jgi:hypothetical protein
MGWAGYDLHKPRGQIGLADWRLSLKNRFRPERVGLHAPLLHALIWLSKVKGRRSHVEAICGDRRNPRPFRCVVRNLVCRPAENGKTAFRAWHLASLPVDRVDCGWRASIPVHSFGPHLLGRYLPFLARPIVS